MCFCVRRAHRGPDRMHEEASRRFYGFDGFGGRIRFNRLNRWIDFDGGTDSDGCTGFAGGACNVDDISSRRSGARTPAVVRAR